MLKIVRTRACYEPWTFATPLHTGSRPLADSTHASAAALGATRELSAATGYGLTNHGSTQAPRSRWPSLAPRGPGLGQSAQARRCARSLSAWGSPLLRFHTPWTPMTRLRRTVSDRLPDESVQAPAVPGLRERLGVHEQLSVVDPPIAPGDLLDATDLRPLPVLDDPHELAGVLQ